MPPNRLFTNAILIVLTIFGITGCATPNPPPTVARVDLNRYAGRWYEISKLPQSFEKDCVDVTADYSLLPNGKVKVVNTCHKDAPAGEVKTISGTARSVNAPDNTRLKVMFFWPFEGDYWVFRLSPDYTTAAVGSPDRRSLWILHRTPHMNDAEYQQLIDSLRVDGFPVDHLVKTIQPVASAPTAGMTAATSLFPLPPELLTPPQ